MKSTFRILFYVKRDKVKSDGTLPVMCRFTIDGQAARFNTKVNVNPNIWDSKAATAIGKSHEAVGVNALLSVTQIISRAVYPASELKTARWLKENSALCELTGINPSDITKDTLYAMAHRLYREKNGLERHFSKRTNDLFSLNDRIIICDLSYTE